MRVSVLLFAGLREAAGVRGGQVEVGADASVEDVVAEVGRRWPGTLGRLRTAAVAVNLEYAERGHRVHEGDEVALVPPVSGGRQ